MPGGHLHLLVASPACTHHSNARGGKPMEEQSRATAWHVLRWVESLYVENVLIENVREFRDWGPLYPKGHETEFRPIPKKKGEFYRLFLYNLRKLGYTVSERLLNAADYGDATTRQRLFIQARRKDLGGKVKWPVPTHIKPVAGGLPGLMDGLPTWKPAREIIDWSLPSHSIYKRKRPLAPATLARIFAGLRKYSGLPFFVPNLSEREGQMPRTHAVDAPLPTVTSVGAGNLVEPVVVPFLVSYYGHGNALSVDEPLDTVTSRDRFALVDPQLLLDGFVDKGKVVGWLDIRFRMLQPHELAAAMSFPSGYRFAGNREAQVKQIGNSVAVATATALCLEILKGVRQ